MTREMIGASLLALAIIFHALFPRYEFRLPTRETGPNVPYRFDRWTGRVEMGAPNRIQGSQDWWFAYMETE